MKQKKNWFSEFAKKVSFLTGTPTAFAIAVAVIIIWALTGIFFQFNDTWQLVINTGTTIVTFLMVFLIQNSQNRDSVALQLKLDELIRADEKAHNSLMDLEELETHELESIRKKYEELAGKARKELRSRDDILKEFDVEKGI